MYKISLYFAYERGGERRFGGRGGGGGGGGGVGNGKDRERKRQLWFHMILLELYKCDYIRQTN